MIENGNYITKWKHEYEMGKRPYHEEYKTNKLKELQLNKRDLENKLDTIKRITNYETN